jgi:hypothetical protein
MPTLILALLLGVPFALVGIITWLIGLLFRVRGRGRRIARNVFLAWLAALPVWLFLAVPLLGSWLLSQASTRPDERNLTSLPADFGAEFESVRFPSRDLSLQLSGWWLPAASGKPAVVFGHGLFRSRREILERACALNRCGYPALLFDFRGHGDSDPGPITLGYRERLDVLGAVDYAHRRTGLQQTLVAGVSMGATAALLAAAEDPGQVAGVLADSPFLSLHSTVGRHVWLFLRLPAFPFAQVFSWNLGRLGSFPPEELDLRRALPRLDSIPVLLVYGRDDPRMPPEEAEEILRLVPSAHKRLWFVEGAGHGAAFQKQPEAYVAEFRRWFETPRTAAAGVQSSDSRPTPTTVGGEAIFR